MSSKVEVLESGIRIIEVEIQGKEVSDYFRAVSEDAWEATLTRAVEVGVFCLERARTSQDTEFVRRQMDSLLARVDRAVQEIPNTVQERLLSKIGTSDGQVLRPLQAVVDSVAAVLTTRLTEIRDFLAREVDPTKETSALGGAVRELRELLDTKRADSIQATLAAAVANVTSAGGELSATITKEISRLLQPLTDEVNRLSVAVGAKDAVEEALRETTAKGADFEEQTVQRLQSWAEGLDAEVSHVGGDNQPGDVFVRSSDELGQVGVVIEVRDRQAPKGRKAVNDDMTLAMATRDAHAGVYLSRSRDGLAKELGEWGQGHCDRGPWIATTEEHLTTALRYVIAQRQLALQRAQRPEVDAAAIEVQLLRITTTLDKVANINRSLTSIGENADTIRKEAEDLRREVRSALSSIEDALRKKPPETQAGAVA
jgi:hypothetical protein